MIVFEVSILYLKISPISKAQGPSHKVLYIFLNVEILVTSSIFLQLKVKDLIGYLKISQISKTHGTLS
jgi:hypothetical protein